MHVIPAQPGFFLVDGTEDYAQHIPILGWVCVGAHRLLPLLAGNAKTLVAGHGVLHSETGAVTDLVTGKDFVEEDDFIIYVRETDDYRPGTANLPALAYPGSPVFSDAQPVQPSKAPPKATAVVPAGTAINVDFSGKFYAKQSFWQAPEENPAVVFVVEPDAQCPASGARKITREDYQTLKRSLPVVMRDAIEAGWTHAAQPEETATSEPEDEADDMI